LAVAQLGLWSDSVAFQGWHLKGSRDLITDFDLIPLRRRVVELVPDADVQTKPAVHRGAESLAVALAARGALPRLVRLPMECAA
jgi:hypothetical protein